MFNPVGIIGLVLNNDFVLITYHFRRGGSATADYGIEIVVVEIPARSLPKNFAGTRG
jgi:hypothetical protein